MDILTFVFGSIATIFALAGAIQTYFVIKETNTIIENL